MKGSEISWKSLAVIIKFICLLSQSILINMSLIYSPLYGPFMKRRHILWVSYFSVPTTQISEVTINTRFENLYDRLSTLASSSFENQIWFKAKQVDIEHQFHSSESKRRSILTSQHFKSFKKLLNNADIIIVKPDIVYGVLLLRINPVTKIKCNPSLVIKTNFWLMLTPMD